MFLLFDGGENPAAWTVDSNIFFGLNLGAGEYIGFWVDDIAVAAA